MSGKSRPHKEPLTEQQCQEIVRMAESGMTAKEIAPHFDRHYATVHTVLNRAGIHLVNKIYKLTDQQKQEICARYRGGNTEDFLANLYGLSLSSIQSILRVRGVEPRQAGNQPMPKGPRMCPICGVKILLKRHRYCDDCFPSHDRKIQREWRKATIAKGICPSCSKPLGRKGSYCQVCLDRITAINVNLKIKCFAHYGSRCTCCGEGSNLAFLGIDHVNNDGGERRRSGVYKGNGLGAPIYRWLIKNDFPDGYTLLCHNCNLGKKINGICPHKISYEPS